MANEKIPKQNWWSRFQAQRLPEEHESKSLAKKVSCVIK